MNLSNNQFSLVIAYLLPGFITLGGLAPIFPILLSWLTPTSYSEASLGPPVYVLLAATTLGLIASCIRWIAVDHALSWMGVRAPEWADEELPDRLAAFNYLVESHYRYYQFVANTLVAVAFGYGMNRVLRTSSRFSFGTDVLVVLLCAVLFAASRDALMKYYKRTSQLLNTSKKGRKV